MSWLSVSLAAGAVLAAGFTAAAIGKIPGYFISDVGVRNFTYDFAVGYLVSYVFFIIVVVIPERARRRRTKAGLLASYRNFKLRCIEIYLSAIGDSWDAGQPEALLDPAFFSDYFSARYSPDQNRWHAVHNGLYEYGVPQLIVECEVFSREIQFTLIKLEVEDEAVAHYLSRISASLIRLKTSSPSYDDIKSLLSFLYPIHSHWNWLDGQLGSDPIGDMIARI